MFFIAQLLQIGVFDPSKYQVSYKFRKVIGRAFFQFLRSNYGSSSVSKRWFLHSSGCAQYYSYPIRQNISGEKNDILIFSR